jgi:hypothetical protein
MAKIASKDTYAIEDVGEGTEVRRLVKAGTLIPDHYQVDSGDYTETDERGRIDPTIPAPEEGQTASQPSGAAGGSGASASGDTADSGSTARRRSSS